MTIAKRLLILLAVPLLILAGIGVFTRQQMTRIEERTRFVAESRVAALARRGDLSRSFAEMSRCLLQFDAHRGVFAALYPPADLAAFEPHVEG